MQAFFIKNKDAGKENGGYAQMDEIIKELVIIKDGVDIRLTGEEAMKLYNLIKPISAPTHYPSF